MPSHATVQLTHNRAPIAPTNPPAPINTTHKVHINPHNPDEPKDLRSIIFNPDLDTSAQVIQALLHPNNSLAGIALENKTTIEALSTWMADPDVAIRIFNMKRAAAVQHSLAATFQLKHATNALVIILQEFADSACHAAGIKAGRGASPSEHIRRDRETARKASHLLARLANFDQTIRPPRKHTLIQNPRGNAGATGATQPAAPSGPPQLSEDPAALLTEIHALLAHIGAPTSLTTPIAPSEPLATTPTALSVPSVPSVLSDLSAPSPAPETPQSQTEDLPASSASSRSERNMLSPGRETRENASDNPEPAERATHETTDASTGRLAVPPSPAFLAKVAACNCDRYHRCKGCTPDVITARYELDQARARDPTRPGD